MLTNPRADRVRSVAALSRRSARERAGLFVAEGPQSVREAVRFRPEVIRDLYVTAEAGERHTEIVDAATAAGVHVHECTPEVLAAMSDTDAPQGLLAVCRAAQAASPADVPCAGTALRANSTSAVKAAASLTARSARILRSTSTSAALRPCMNRL